MTQRLSKAKAVLGDVVLTGGLTMERCKTVSLTASDSGGGVAAWTPGKAVMVTKVIIDVTTASSGACTVDIGVAANATTLSDTLIDGLSVASIAVSDNIDDKGTNGGFGRKVSSSQSVTASRASGASSGLVGNLYIFYVEI